METASRSTSKGQANSIAELSDSVKSQADKTTELLSQVGGLSLVAERLARIESDMRELKVNSTLTTEELKANSASLAKIRDEFSVRNETSRKTNRKSKKE